MGELIMNKQFLYKWCQMTESETLLVESIHVMLWCNTAAEECSVVHYKVKRLKTILCSSILAKAIIIFAALGIQ